MPASGARTGTDDFADEGRPGKQRRRRTPEPTSPISREEIVDNYDSENNECKTYRAYQPPFLQVLKAAIACRQHQESCLEI
jgi:hypothetical protein